MNGSAIDSFVGGSYSSSKVDLDAKNLTVLRAWPVKNYPMRYLRVARDLTYRGLMTQETLLQNSSIAANASENELPELPLWETPSITLLEVESGTLTGGGGASEFGFTSS